MASMKMQDTIWGEVGKLLPGFHMSTVIKAYMMPLESVLPKCWAPPQVRPISVRAQVDNISRVAF